MNKTKREKTLTCVLSALLPIMLFLGAACLLNYIPFGNINFEIFDSHEQYSGFIMALKEALSSGNFLHSWSGGLGFNLYSSLTYYAFSPLNLLMTLANSQNYSFFFAIVTFIRIGLLGLTMSIYLKEKKLSNLSIVVLSTVYALMGFTSAYYYNYIWLDSIILLPLVFLGLENLLKKGKSITYILTLALAIICNYYIGYIICLFVGIYFLSQLFISTNKKALLKSFVLSTLLALLLSSFVTIPSFFALLEGKASNFSLANLNGVALDWYRIPYLMMSGSSLRNGFKFKGVSQVYTSILVLALVLFYFLNRNIDKKEKRASLGVVIFFYLSFSLNALNLIWHMFQQPIWWSSRFSFCFSFFLIKLAADELAAFEDMPQNKRLKLLTINSLVILFSSITIFFKNSSMTYINLVFLLFSVCLLAIYILFLGRFPIKVFLLLTILDVGLNTYVNLSINKDAYMKSVSSQELRRSKNTIDAILSEDDDFYRIERVDKTLVNDGLYYGYPTITYFNSVSNTRTNRLLNSLGFETTSALVDFYKHSATEPLALDPFVMSILNIKYFEGSNDYLTKVEDEFYKNEHPLSRIFSTAHLERVAPRQFPRNIFKRG